MENMLFLKFQKFDNIVKIFDNIVKIFDKFVKNIDWSCAE